MTEDDSNLRGQIQENLNLQEGSPESRSNNFVITVEAINKILESTQGSQSTGALVGFPSFDPDHSRVDIQKWCTDIDARVQRDGLQNFDILPRIQVSLLGRAKLWFNKYGYQLYSWPDLRASLIHAFSNGTDIITQLRKVANSESNEYASYTEFVMEKVCQINQLPFEIPEDKMVKIVIGCISEVSLRNSLTFVMPSTVQSLISHLSSIREKPLRKVENITRRLQENKPVSNIEKEDKLPNPLKRRRVEDEKRCYGCGKKGHIRAHCTEKQKTNELVVQKIPSKPIETKFKCSFCGKSGHEEQTCWAKQRADRKQINLCKISLVSDNYTPVVIKGKLYHCLLDTGSDCSLVRSDIADKISAKRTTNLLSVQGIGREPILLSERLETFVEFEDLIVEVSLYLIDKKHLQNEIIIGRDILKDPTITITVTANGSYLHRSKSAFCLKSKNIVTTTGSMSKPRTKELNVILDKYSKHFIAGFPTARVTTGSLSIRLTKDANIFFRPYRMAHSERQITKEIVADLINNGIIRESHSPFASPMILVKKKNGQNRLCVDFRALNKITVKDRYPLPRIEDQLDELSGNKYFTSLDMASGFHQIPIAEDSIEKTAFVTPDGHYEYLRMPFGLANAPAVFQRAINVALGELQGKLALVYMDDVLITSKTIDEGLEKLDIVLKALVGSGFTLNMDKCKFLQTTIEYLGREVSGDGIRPSKTKIDALVSSPTPSNVKQIRQFMGLANYFRKFVPEFAAKTACITALTKNNTEFVWSSECQAAKDYIVEQLTTRPLLVLFNPDLPTELHTDASASGYGAILFQRVNGRLHVVAYYSQATKSYEAKYHSYELETLAVVNAMKHFRHYLIGVKFLLVTDCNALKATKEKKNLLPRVARWWIFLQDFEFEIVYRKGKTLSHVDYFSRNVPTKSCYQIESLSETWLHIEQQNDPGTLEIIEKTKGGDTNTSTQFKLKNGLLYKKLENTNKLYVPQQCRLSLMRRFHEENCHVGWEKTLMKIREHFWMPHMTKNVRKFVNSCLICLVAKRPSGKKQCELHPIEKKPIPFDVVHADFMGPFDGKDYRYIFILIDAFTKFAVLFPCKTLTAAETVQMFYSYVMLFGAPAKLVSDRGTNFTSAEFKNVCMSFGITHHLIAPGASRANGQVERYVDTVANLLRTNLDKCGEWTGYISRVQLALNTTVNKTTGFSPLKVLTGISGRTPDVSAFLAELEIEPQFDDVEEIRKLASERAELNATRMKIRFDQNKCKPTQLKIGQKVVYCSNQRRKSKLQPYYRGPYEIVGVLPNDRYKLKKENCKTFIVAAREVIRPLNESEDEKDVSN